MLDRSLPLLALTLSLMLPGCGDDGTPQGGSEESSGSGSGSSTGSTTADPTTTPMTGATSTGMADSGTDAGSTTPATDSGSADSGSGESGSDSTGEEESVYPPCMPDADPVCPRPYEVCYEFAGPDHSVCTHPCERSDQCPQPSSGDAVAVCAGQDFDQCLLDCSDDATCPDGMECLEIGDAEFFRCAWPNR